MKKTKTVEESITYKDIKQLTGPLSKTLIKGLEKLTIQELSELTRKFEEVYMSGFRNGKTYSRLYDVKPGKLRDI